MKKIISLFLAVIMLSCSTVTAFCATENVKQQVFDLLMYTYTIQDTYGIYPEPGDACIDFTYESYERLRLDTDYVLEKIDGFYVDLSSVTQEMIDETYAFLDASVAQIRIETSEVEFLLDICKPEQNINNYYSDEVWTEFQQCISNAENALNTGANEDDLTKAYWDLRYAFNKLCSYNQLVGDVDGNGIVNVNDCTLLSKAVAGLTTLNFSQKFVCAGTAKITVNNVTDIQKYLAFGTELNDVALTEVSENVYSQDKDTNHLLHRLVFDREWGWTYS